MASEKQVAANRRNALKSTGPRTPEGKSTVSMNAVTHGLLARDALLPDEDAGEHAALLERVTQALQPVGDWEGILVDRIIQGLWRLHRLSRVEAGLFSAAVLDEGVANARREVSQLNINALFTDAAFKKGYAVAQAAAQAARAATLPTLGQAFVAREATLATLSRYEATIERGVFKAWHELQRCQAERHGHDVAPPVVGELDVDVRIEGEHAEEAKQTQCDALGETDINSRPWF